LECARRSAANQSFLKHGMALKNFVFAEISEKIFCLTDKYLETFSFGVLHSAVRHSATPNSSLTFGWTQVIDRVKKEIEVPTFPEKHATFLIPFFIHGNFFFGRRASAFVFNFLFPTFGWNHDLPYAQEISIKFLVKQKISKKVS
jgi:hypothetical protein